MNLTFRIRPSKYLSSLLFVFLLLTMVTIWQFALAPWVKLLIMVLSSLWCLREIAHVQTYDIVLQFERQLEQWRVSINDGPFVIVNRLAPIYLGSQLVWLKLDCRQIRSRTLLIFVDALPKEKFLQLRRCILGSRTCNVAKD